MSKLTPCPFCGSKEKNRLATIALQDAVQTMEWIIRYCGKSIQEEWGNLAIEAICDSIDDCKKELGHE